MSDLLTIKQKLAEYANKAKMKRVAGDNSSRDSIISDVSKEIVKSFSPFLEELAKNSKISKQELQAIADGIDIKVPEIESPVMPEIPPIKVPRPEVTVNVPPIKIPEIKMPEEMTVRGWVGLMGVDLQNPLPVTIRNADGSPALLGGGSVGGGGGGFRHVIVDNLDDISISSSGGLTDAELRATALFVAQVSGHSWSVNASISDVVTTRQSSGFADSVSVIDIFGTVGANLINPDNRLKVELPTGSSGLTDTEIRATALPVTQVSGASWSVEAVVTATNLDIRDLANASDSISNYQISGHAWSVYATGAASSFFAEISNPDGRVKVELPTGSSGLTDTELRASHLDVQQLSGSSDSVNVVTTVGLTDTQLRASHIDVVQMSGGIDSVYVTGIASSSFTELQNGDGRLRVSVETGGSGITDSELRATPVPVQQVSGYSDSVYVTGAASSTFQELLNPDGRVKVELPTGSSGLTDTELRATAVPIIQVSGASDSVNVLTMPAVVVTSITNTTATNIVDSSGVGYSGSNPVPVTGTVIVSGVTASTAVVALDRDGNPLTTGPIGLGDAATALRVVIAGNSDASVTATLAASSTVNVNGSLNSVIAVGATLHDAVDVGSAPQKVGGVAVTTANPTAVAGGDIVNFRADDLGRQLIRPLQVRDLIKTARATLTNGTETTLLAAVAGSYLDCVSVMCANSSDVAVSVDLRAVTAGNILQTIQIPASGTAGWVPQVPWPQDETGNNWTADIGDITGTTVTISALFSQEL